MTSHLTRRLSGASMSAAAGAGGACRGSARFDQTADLGGDRIQSSLGSRRYRQFPGSPVGLAGFGIYQAHRGQLLQPEQHGRGRSIRGDGDDVGHPELAAFRLCLGQLQKDPARGFVKRLIHVTDTVQQILDALQELYRFAHDVPFQLFLSEFLAQKVQTSLGQNPRDHQSQAITYHKCKDCQVLVFIAVSPERGIHEKPICNRT